jgi:hypothetical protein|eukprot:scaffold13315_cov205-Alexandrium_tamarense.AAC.4
MKDGRRVTRCSFLLLIAIAASWSYTTNTLKAKAQDTIGRFSKIGTALCPFVGKNTNAVQAVWYDPATTSVDKVDSAENCATICEEHFATKSSLMALHYYQDCEACVHDSVDSDSDEFSYIRSDAVNGIETDCYNVTRVVYVTS